ncbi:MAG: AIDA repeat-containing protein, partial [Lentisphaeria bacterium]|nr:AIDA repeat-containing protein [Lentisphaeria bacterium]
VSSAKVSSGLKIGSGKIMKVLSGGTANQTTVSSGGVMNVAGKANYTSAFKGGTVTVSNGGSMFGVNLYSGANLNISSGGNVNTLFYNGAATATIHSGGQLTSTTVNSSGTLNVYDGAKVTSATLKNGGTMNYHGGTVYNVDLLYGGVMNIQSGAVRKGQIADKGQMFVSNGGVASGAIIKNGGIQHVLSGGSADDTQIWLNGVVHVSSGAIVTDMLTKHGAKVHVFGGTISNTTMERGITSVYQGGTAVETEVGYGAYLMLGFTNSGCSGVASSYDTVVSSGGGLTVMSGAVAEDNVIYGTLNCNNGGILLGETTIHSRANLAGNAVVTDETSITFDVSEREVSAMQESYYEAMLNSYYVAREADMTISVAADQASGSYILANWALEAKKGTFTLEVDGTEVGTFSTTKSLTYYGKTYSLYCFDDATNSKALTLKVSDATATDAWTDLGSGDFDGDGIEESLVSDGTNLYAASEDLWLGNLSGTEEIASIADYNNDGTDDLLIHNTATDQMTAWLVKDGATYSTLAIA